MFISLRYRPNKWPFWGLLGLEFPLTVALLALFGIAAPNLYRTKLWADGAANGFNSSPVTGLYAAANYRPYTAPKVWSQFITNFNLVISVFSMFLMLAKSAMYLLHVFPPLLSVLCHAALVALYSVSIAYQAGSDMSDPRRPQPGAPWYISKSCSVAQDKKLVGYCQQAKSAFACTVVILLVFIAQLVLAVFSLFPSASHRASRESKRLARESRWAHLDSPTLESKVPAVSLNAIANAAPNPEYSSSTSAAAGALNPMTPRTLAFNRLGGTKDLPLRNHFNLSNLGAKDDEGGGSGSEPKRSRLSSRFGLRSPTFSGNPLGSGGGRVDRKVDEEVGAEAVAAGPSGSNAAATTAGSTGMYFPPPPKVPTK